MIRIVIADDQQLFRDLLEHMLKNSGEIEVVASAQNGSEAVEAVEKYSPDVILMDIIMPYCTGTEAIKRIREKGLETKILVLTVSYDERDVEEAIRNGADGYILKSVNKEELILAIKSVYSDMEVIHKDVRQIMRNVTLKTSNKKSNNKLIIVNGIEVELSDRDLKIIAMVIDGKSTSEMAKELFVAEGRLRNIITEIISKLMLKDRTQLAVFAIKSKLIE